jgi:hypothetical protein
MNDREEGYVVGFDAGETYGYQAGQAEADPIPTAPSLDSSSAETVVDWGSVPIVGGNFTVPAVEKIESCEGPHCWHYASFQHTVPHHRDEVCCNCGLARCVSTWHEDMKAREGHGRFMP